MTTEEMERAIRFILEQQAQFSTDIQRLTETSGVLVKSQIDLTHTVGTLTGIVGQLAGSHRQLAESHRQLAESHRQIAESHRELAEAHKRTENTVADLADRVNMFISVVERHIAGN